MSRPPSTRKKTVLPTQLPPAAFAQQWPAPFSTATSPAPSQPIACPLLLLYQEQTCAVDLLCHQTNITPEQQLGVWLTLGAGALGQLFDAGWSLEQVLDSLRVVLQAVQGMSALTRRELLKLSGAVLLNGIPLPAGKHIAEEERMQLTKALGESIGAGWKSFQRGSIAQILTIGHAQLSLLQQVHTFCDPITRPSFYSAVYRLIGAALFFQARYKAEVRLKMGEPRASIVSAQAALPLIIALDSPLISWVFFDYTQRLLARFPSDPEGKAFVEQALRQIALPAHRTTLPYLEAQV